MISDQEDDESYISSTSTHTSFVDDPHDDEMFHCFGGDCPVSRFKLMKLEGNIRGSSSSAFTTSEKIGPDLAEQLAKIIRSRCSEFLLGMTAKALSDQLRSLTLSAQDWPKTDPLWCSIPKASSSLLDKFKS
ncbi:hypothetical protein THAOC_14670 [Thalassiosira oceanica]|uniref:Uncharacterized protein n=1 Tax=Thalassiosira oceanica TaxID=159749 RepID=K0SEN9_THAOC|nr:hypothetical protein THAOC_14670 [Thalassiosira oceanica]|eukprot:EJK64583.1 hypothetical protein THAOC_14670 [Thalassiosira oceanica]